MLPENGKSRAKDTFPKSSREDKKISHRIRFPGKIILQNAEYDIVTLFSYKSSNHWYISVSLGIFSFFLIRCFLF